MANTPISPKVTSAAAVGSIVGLFLSFANAATPDTFAALGKWSYPAFLLVSLGAAVASAYLKADPLRDLGQSLSQPTAPDAPAAAPAAPVTVAPAATFPAAKIDALPTEAPAPAAPVEVVPVVPAAPAA